MASALGDVWAATTGKRLALASGSAYPKTISLLFAGGTSSRAIRSGCIPDTSRYPTKLSRFAVGDFPSLAQKFGSSHWDARIILVCNVFRKQAGRTSSFEISDGVDRPWQHYYDLIA